ncbi:hypothetical protein RB614_17310 [Phytohabitans sp. ZYX-F-186]|uniref:Band 7 domain-containing protein n=1 Tax=Phytohabitans maris TaxID=3071409 RepID=A0ABU0ZGU0_9ACTN|nr:hypothetical protein [Phytohabitans sp. ZYX-F-186]MDQ7906274.1 hypothetical protein [Phytohabitans sp. ZYX-F-186]
MAVDRPLPHGGIEFGDNGIPPISWPHWFVAAALVALASGCFFGSLIGGGSGAAYGAGLGVVLAGLTLAMPIRMRDYRLPEPAALRVARDGLHVYAVAKQGRRVRTYVYLPWHTVGALTLIGTARTGPVRPALRIVLTDAGREAVAAAGSAGTLTVPDVGTADLIGAVAGYSGGRHRVDLLHEAAARGAPRFEVVLYGYDIGQVDALVRRVEAAMSANGVASRPAVRDELAAGPVLPEGPRGYDRTQVDDFLRRATLRLDQDAG